MPTREEAWQRPGEDISKTTTALKEAIAHSSSMLREIRVTAGISQSVLAQRLGTSFVSLNRWERGASEPSMVQLERIKSLHQAICVIPNAQFPAHPESVFLARGIRDSQGSRKSNESLALTPEPRPPLLPRLLNGDVFAAQGRTAIAEMLHAHTQVALTAATPPVQGMSAGKNTYTYDAHTYHTKVPPQGIAELINHYLPQGGLVFDPFAGSGMTGVAARATGCSCILNELSPAAAFIADRFVDTIEPTLFQAGVETLLRELKNVRAELYTTECRVCGKAAEILYTVWSYKVLCNHCSHEFLLWDCCRKYGRVVREHKILAEFPCPGCGVTQKKSTLRRTTAHPVLLGYKCCRAGPQEAMHPLNDKDWARLRAIETSPPLATGFYPTNSLPEGVNLRQPLKHGLNRVDKFYTARNLAALSQLWHTIHRIEETHLAASLAFVFTSLYQRVTRLSEFRFWGGSGNTARFNVPYIFNEANVFLTFQRKAKSILDHLAATASQYRGQAVVVRNSATSLGYLPDDSVDLIFTDPPFGANINYSEMNLLWESWLGVFTDATEEVIINKYQGKDIVEYQRLMAQSMKECYRVLRPGHWMALVFMNSSREVWKALQRAISEAGFVLQKIDIFDKQHGTFKQFVSSNTAGCDLVLHCLKPSRANMEQPVQAPLKISVEEFLSSQDKGLPTNVYLHVARPEEIDFRKLYSKWLAQALLAEADVIDFGEFREIAHNWLRKTQ